MRLYKTKGSDAEITPRFCWQGTQADAATARKTMKADGFKNVETEEIDVPTDKAGLLAWLNENCTGE